MYFSCWGTLHIKSALPLIRGKAQKEMSFLSSTAFNLRKDSEGNELTIPSVQF